MEKKNLKQKLLEVSKAIKYLKKDKRNTGQNYNYLSEAKIKEIIKREFEKQGVLFHYSTDDITQYEISPTHKGTKQFVTNIKGRYKFIDVDSDAFVAGTWAGSGMDSGDKGLYKAITGGIKYVLNTNFLIPSGDDPENDNEKPDHKPAQQPEQKPQGQASQPEPKKEYHTDPTDKRLISEPQRIRYETIGGKMGWKDEEMKELVKTFGYEHSKDIQRKDYNKICELLEKGIQDIPNGDNKQADLLDDMKKATKENVVNAEMTALQAKALDLKKEMARLTGSDVAYSVILEDLFSVENVIDLSSEDMADFVTVIANKVIDLQREAE